MFKQLLWATLLWATQATAQGDQVPANLVKFVPKGYSILDSASGDLNKDAYPDMILVLKKNGEEDKANSDQKRDKRPMLVLVGQADKSYKQAARCESAVDCVDCGGMMGDPFMGITIKDGYFSLEHEGGSTLRWTRVITFKYSPTDKYWYLYKDGFESVWLQEPDKVTKKMHTAKQFGKVPVDKFDVNKNYPK